MNAVKKLDGEKRMAGLSMQLKLALISAVVLGFASGCGQPPKTEAHAPLTVSKSAFVPTLKTNVELDRVAFGSCSDPRKPQPLWETILNKHPQIYISMGDVTYADKPELKPFSKAYKMQSENPDFAAFRAKIPMIGIWDDGEYGQNDGGADNPEKDIAKTAFLEFFPNDAADIHSKQDGLYHSFIIGKAKRRLQIIFLDTRYFRDPLEKNENPKSPLDVYAPTQDTKKTILGEDQWKWFEQELQRPAELRLIISSIQLISAEHGFEKWANFPHERQRFFDLLSKLKIRNAVVLSGDRHMGEVSKITLMNVGDLYDITASSVNKNSGLRGEKNSARVGIQYPDENFGLLDIDWKQNKAKFHLIDLKGQPFSEVTFRFHH
jgi:alkaline phosphatase D